MVDKTEVDDYRPGDEFDWDQSDDSQHCQHGTFIGSAWGPDLLCGWCESGATEAEYRGYLARIRRDGFIRRANAIAFDDISRIARERRDLIRSDSAAFAVWVGAFLAEITETDTHSLASFVGD
jgi:hypothetical protein